MYITVKTPTVRDVNPTNTKTGKYKNPLKILIKLQSHFWQPSGGAYSQDNLWLY